MEITIKDKNYPELLKKIKNPPEKLYVRGNLCSEEKYPLAVVGTRRVSNYGAQITTSLVKDLVGQGFTIISGLALGVDSLAHRAALSAGGKTIAVLGSGLDIIYPSSHKGLAENIVQAGGALVSEYPAGTKPFKGNFPARNRIISGLSLGVLVTEAPEKSGALITAGCGLDQGRELFAVPGSVYNQASVGTNWLIKMGAKPVTGSQDVLDAFGLELEVETKKEIKPGSPEEALLLKHLSHEPIHIDRLINFSKLSPQEVSGLLMTMELAGKVKNMGSGYYVLA